MASTVTQSTAAPQDRSSDAASGQRVTAREWFASGARRPYDPIAKAMLETGSGEDSSQRLHVFEKVVATAPVGAETRWLTMLPGYPDGSYGYAQVDRYLGLSPPRGCTSSISARATPTSRSGAATRPSSAPT